MMKIILKTLFAVSFIATVTVLGLAVFFWTPDISRQQAVQEYANAESRFFSDAFGNSIHYRDQGLRSRPALILIHGTSASLHTWEPLVQELREQYRLISFDLLGHGLTGETIGREYSADAYSAALIALMEHLNVPSATLVGNSLGGRIAWQTAASYPDLVNSLILLAPSGAKRVSLERSNIGFKIMNSRVGRYLSLKFTPRFLIKRSLEQTVVDQSLITSSMVDRYWRLLRMAGNRRAMSDVFSAPRDAKTGVDRDIASLNHPKLVIWGDKDQILPIEMLSQFRSIWKDGSFFEISNIGHLPQEEAVAIVTSTLDRFCRLKSC